MVSQTSQPWVPFTTLTKLQCDGEPVSSRAYMVTNSRFRLTIRHRVRRQDDLVQSSMDYLSTVPKNLQKTPRSQVPLSQDAFVLFTDETLLSMLAVHRGFTVQI